MTEQKEYTISIGSSILWVFGYFCVMLLYTLIDIMFWRKFPESISDWHNIITIAICSTIYLAILIRKNNLGNLNLWSMNWVKMLLGIICAFVLYLLLDCFIDQMIESIFPASEAVYQETVSVLKESPITSLIQVCIIAPITEEILMRGFVLEMLKKKYHVGLALLVSTVLFALLHFNMVQTLSALVSGFLLGILYIKTGSVVTTILTHALYNLLSFLSLMTLL